MTKNTNNKKKQNEAYRKMIVVSIFATKEQERLFSKHAQKSMLNNAKSK